MRPVLLAALALLTAPVADAARVLVDQWLESSVTLSLTFSHTGDPQLKPGKNDTTTRTTPLVATRLGNREILAALVTRGLIDETRGWRLVARWERDLSAYVFYARKGSGSATASIPVPDDLLAFMPISGAGGIRQSVRVEGEEIASIISGTENIHVFSRLTLETSAHIGNLNGTWTGTGRYVRLDPEGESAEFVPNETSIKLQGVYTPGEGETVGVASGSLRMGKAGWVKIYENHPSGIIIDGSIIGGIDTGVIVSPN